MSHLKSNPIQELRRILRDHYSVGSILKELVQNADDAGAREIHLTTLPSWPDGVHPLLTGPTLFVLNDGEFRDVDNEGIITLNEGAKGGDQGSIGKYGLGMKSVFHLCEGIFYAASADQPGAGGKPAVCLLNPWGERGPHDDWGDLRRASPAILETIENWEHGCNRWFCLGIPLRLPEHLGEAEAIVQGHFPSLEEVRKSLDLDSLVLLTVLLRTVSRFAIWEGQYPKSHSLIESASVDSGALRRAYGSEDRAVAPGETIPLRISVSNDNAKGAGRLIGAGIERLLDDPIFETLKSDPGWPKNYTQDPKRGSSQLREKGEPHCAVVLSKRSRNREWLEVTDAVFLPLTDGSHVGTAAPLGGEYQFLLHGQFFLDAGRRSLYKGDGGENDIQRKWNERLLTLGVLPLLPEALSEFVSIWETPRDEIFSITRALQDSEFFQGHRSEICSEHNWLAPIEPGLERPSWRLEESSQRYLLFPTLKGRIATAQQLFPGGLEDICGGDVLVETASPRLVKSPATRWQEAPELLLRLLASIDSDRLVEVEPLALLTEFLNEVGRELPPEAVTTLAAKLRAAIAGSGIPPLERVGERFGSLLGVLPGTVWVGLGPLDADTVPVLRDLNRLDISPAIVPSTLIPDTDAAQSDGLCLKDAATILEWLSSTADERDRTRTAAVALRVVEATEAPIAEKRAQLGNYPVWLTRDGSDSGESLKGWDELKQICDDGRLFSGGSALLRAMQDALRDKSLYSLYSPRESRPFETLFELAEPPTCDVGSCINLLSQTPPPTLSPPEGRVSLLEKLKSSVKETRGSDLAAVRYLLHGFPEKASDLETELLTRSAASSAGHLAVVAEGALRQLDSEWRWVNEGLWTVLTNAEQQALGVTAVDVAAIEGLLHESGTEWIEDLALSETDATALLMSVNDPDLWWRLPLHNTLGGERRALEQRGAFLASDYTGAPSIRSVATIVDPAGAPALRQKYLTQGVPSWSPTAAIDVGLAQDVPSEFCMDILDAIRELQGRSMSSERLEKLRDVGWLVNRDGSPVAPRDVVVIDGMEDYLQRLLLDPKLNGVFTCLPNLEKAVREHPGIAQLRSLKILPDRSSSAEVLVVCLAEVPEYHIGSSSNIPNDEEGLDLLLSAFAGVDDHVLPMIPVLRELSEAFSDNRISLARTILPSVRCRLPVSKLQSCVQALSEALVESQAAVQVTARLRVLAGFVKSLFSHPEVDMADLSDLTLPNMRLDLRAVTELCVDQEGIDPRDVVHPDLAPACPTWRDSKQDAPDGPSTSDGDDDAKRDPQILIDYLRNWETLVPRAYRGAFLALFGDEPSIFKEADALLRPGSVKGVRSQLEWTPYALTDFDEDVHESMDRQRFVFRVAADDATERVRNLVGGWFDAHVGGDIDSIFVGSLWPTPPKKYQLEDYRVKVATLRSFDPRDLSRKQREEVLRESVRILLKDVYAQRPTNLAEWWKELSERGQLTLDIVQEQLLRNAWFYFQQLGDRQLPGLRKILREHEELTDRVVELRNSTVGTAKTELRKVQSRLEDLPSDLKRLLTREKEVQHQILERVRSKMSDYQYSATSVPFELFQNADDAAVELIDMIGTDASRWTGKAEVALTSGHFRMRHWGRPINAFARAGFPPETGRKRGYDKDLKKMLILGSSDKSEREELVTGKFGLGFKSVFFLSDRPQVVSGDLGFEVLAGFFPSQLSPEISDGLRSDPQFSREVPAEATVISLPLREGVREKASDAVETFVKLLPVSLIFSRQIKACTISRHQGTQTGMLRERCISRGPTARVSLHHVSAEGLPSELWSKHFLTLRADAGISITFDLGPRGVRRLPPATPTFWVGAPAGGKSGVGFCVNGPFEVDVGRNQLAETQENDKIVSELSNELGSAFIDLFDAGEEWPAFREELDLLPDIEPEDFWTSVWEILSRQAVRDDPLLRKLFWGRDSVISKLVSQRAALPTALPEPYSGLTTFGEVRAVIDGVLDTDPALAGRVFGWPGFQRSWAVGAVVSARRVWSPLSELAEAAEDAGRAIGIVDVLSVEVGPTREVSPEQARYLGRAITRDYLAKWEETGQHSEELRELREFLQSLQFRAVSGESVIAKDLVAPQLGGDEKRRARFASSGSILHDGHDEDGVRFFLACRPEIHADAVRLARWARAAQSLDIRQAVLAYLLDGELGQTLARRLREGGGGDSWLSDIPDECLSAFDGLERVRISALLAKDRGSFAAWWERPELEEEPRAEVDPENALFRIYSWWQENGGDELKDFDQRLYPGGAFFNLTNTAPDEENGRVEWLKLFLLGSLQTIGWTSPERNREFIDQCERRGWLSAFAAAQDEPARWVDAFLEYVGKQEIELRYFQHMKHLVGLAIIARHIDSYVEVFLGADLIDRDFSLEAITAPRGSEFFQRGGPDAPPLTQVLGIGQCMILRELVRHGILTNERLHSHCYVPFRRTRQILQKLGGLNLEDMPGKRSEQSRRIHEFLERHLGEQADFDLAFDIPLQVIAERPEFEADLIGPDPDDGTGR